MSQQFHALVIHLQAMNDARLPATQGHLAHAAFLALVNSVNPALAQTLHDLPGRKPFTISPVWGLKAARQGSHQVAAGQKLRLRLTTLDEDIFRAFIQKLMQGPNQTLRLGQADFIITHVIGAPGSTPWAGFATMDDLVQNAAADPQITLQFASPMALSLGRTGSKKARREVLPIPRYVWASLGGNWRAFTGKSLPPGFEDWVEHNVVVTRVESWRTAMFRFKNSLQVGGQGQVSFRALADAPAMLLVWNLLVDFAFYSGVGVKTGMGMGVVRRLPSENAS